MKDILENVYKNADGFDKSETTKKKLIDGMSTVVSTPSSSLKTKYNTLMKKMNDRSSRKQRNTL